MDIDREVQRQIDGITSRSEEIVPRDELAALLREAIGAGKPLRVKYGIDPTNPHVHIGHLVPCRLLRAMQDFGHTAVLIVGDYTARIGDPTGRNAERPPLSNEEVRTNAERYAEQLFTVVDESRAELHFQSSWFEGLALDEVLRLLASFSVAQMMAHETFRSRLDSGTRLSLHELLYPVLQAYDSLMVRAHVELGGTDQRFNCLCGRDLQRSAGERPQVVVTVPLLAGPDGRKMSKSTGNHIPLSLPPPQVVGRVMSIPDALLPDYVRLASAGIANGGKASCARSRTGRATPATSSSPSPGRSPPVSTVRPPPAPRPKSSNGCLHPVVSPTTYPSSRSRPTASASSTSSSPRASPPPGAKRGGSWGRAAFALTTRPSRTTRRWWTSPTGSSASFARGSAGS